MEVGSCLQPAITVFEYASLIICTFDMRLHIIDVRVLLTISERKANTTLLSIPGLRDSKHAMHFISVWGEIVVNVKHPQQSWSVQEPEVPRLHPLCEDQRNVLANLHPQCTGVRVHLPSRLHHLLYLVPVGQSQIAFRKKMHSAVTVVVLFEKSYLVVNGIRPEGETGPKLSRYTENFEDKFLSDQERDSF
ncbi:unnamed protein product [Hermetia illucens]|uniref:Uncharacterized protein n=1 Tax=Hermetia illucens TaxID=343691 RepID=A0A7R8YR65_HERIL|nr:unnamed protein product [Hermetia illucens]